MANPDYIARGKPWNLSAQAVWTACVSNLSTFTPCGIRYLRLRQKGADAIITLLLP